VSSTVYKPFEQPLRSLDLPSVLLPQFNDMTPQVGYVRIWPINEDEELTLLDSALRKVPKGCVISYQQPMKANIKPECSVALF